jgi:hypothetical protein
VFDLRENLFIPDPAELDLVDIATVHPQERVVYEPDRLGNLHHIRARALDDSFDLCFVVASHRTSRTLTLLTFGRSCPLWSALLDHARKLYYRTRSPGFWLGTF